MRKGHAVRCGWVDRASELMVRYHDEEWGVPVHEDRRLFELLVLEGAQAGLSWSTILAKRAAYRRAFSGFDPRRVARFGAAQRRRLLEDAGIVRNRLKIEAAITNARALLEVQAEHGSFDAFVWSRVDGKPVRGRWRSWNQVPARTPLSEQLSLDLRRRGFRFVGPTICQAWLQAVGVLNDHTAGCFRHRELAGRL